MSMRVKADELYPALDRLLTRRPELGRSAVHDWWTEVRHPLAGLLHGALLAGA